MLLNWLGSLYVFLLWYILLTSASCTQTILPAVIDYVVQGMTPRVTLKTIPLDVLCDIWELFDHVEQLIYEVTDPQQVCMPCVVPSWWMFRCSTLFGCVIWIWYCLLSSETTATLINLITLPEFYSEWCTAFSPLVKAMFSPFVCHILAFMASSWCCWIGSDHCINPSCDLSFLLLYYAHELFRILS